MVLYLIATLCLLSSFILFDILIWLEYTRHKHAWLVDGEAVGFFYSPVKATVARANAGMKLSLSWLFTTPSWIRCVKSYWYLLVAMRACTLAWNVLVILIVSQL